MFIKKKKTVLTSLARLGRLVGRDTSRPLKFVGTSPILLILSVGTYKHEPLVCFPFFLPCFACTLVAVYHITECEHAKYHAGTCATPTSIIYTCVPRGKGRSKAFVRERDTGLVVLAFSCFCLALERKRS